MVILEMVILAQMEVKMVEVKIRRCCEACARATRDEGMCDRTVRTTPAVEP